MDIKALVSLIQISELYSSKPAGKVNQTGKVNEQGKESRGGVYRFG